MEKENRIFIIGIVIFILMYVMIDSYFEFKQDNILRTITKQINSLKKQDSIKELYRVYNIPTGADTLLKPISK